MTRLGRGRDTPAVTHDHLTVRRPGGTTEHRPLEVGELGDRLAELDVGLTPGETATLLGIADRLRADA